MSGSLFPGTAALKNSQATSSSSQHSASSCESKAKGANKSSKLVQMVRNLRGESSAGKDIGPSQATNPSAYIAAEVYPPADAQPRSVNTLSAPPTAPMPARHSHSIGPIMQRSNADARNAHRFSMADIMGRMQAPVSHPKNTLGSGSNGLGHRALVSELLHTVVGAYYSGTKRIKLDGNSLSLGELVAVSRFGAVCSPHEGCKAEVERSRAAMMASLEAGDTVYGVNTMYGGNAASRSQPDKVQNALVGLLYGILPSELTLPANTPFQHNGVALNVQVNADSGVAGQFLSSIVQAHALPAAWVRGAMVIRTNNLLRGHSAVRWEIVDTLSQMVAEEVTPLVPSQGSISASGDLSPLAYIAFAMAANPGVQVLCGSARTLCSSSVALQSASIKPIDFSHKELLAITNGTSVSCSVAAHGLMDAHVLMLLAQLVSAANAEAMMVSQDPYDAFLSDECRPHPGQIEVAANLRSFLTGSILTQKHKSPRSPLARCLQLALDLTDYEAAELASVGEGFFLQQDRYPFRTAPQWLGPPLEDLMHAHRTLTIEMNSSSDNPLVDCSSSFTPRVLHGGNFQALAVTNATEKIRDVAAYVGRILFAQQEELVNPALSNGLPSNLSLAEPSCEGGFKGVSIGCAALTSELGYLASRAGHFVQSAEMHNQSLNSLALISARSTSSSMETLSKLVCSTTVMACQALDLRTCFIAHLRLLSEKVSEWLGIADDAGGAAPPLWAKLHNRAVSDVNLRSRRAALHKLMAVIALTLMRHTSLDSKARAALAAKEGARAMLDLHMEGSLWSSTRNKDQLVCRVMIAGAQLYLQTSDVPHLEIHPASAEDTQSETSPSGEPKANRGRATSLNAKSRLSIGPFTIRSATPTLNFASLDSAVDLEAEAMPAELFFYVLEPALAHVIHKTFEQSRDTYFRASRARGPADASSASESKEQAWKRATTTTLQKEPASNAKLPTSPLPFLGKGTAALYKFVRYDVGIPMHRSVTLDQPGAFSAAAQRAKARRAAPVDDEVLSGGVDAQEPPAAPGKECGAPQDEAEANDEETIKVPRRTLGEDLSLLYEALRDPSALLAALDTVISVDA